MSVLWTSDEAARATGGDATADWEATSVSIDTRTLEPGALFVALKDARDGHDFVAQALERGAAAALVSHVPEGVAPDAPLLVVPDVLEGLTALAKAARKRTAAKVVGITGSVGKTSTKEMLRVMLAGQGSVHAAEKSYNNHWGVPLTLARMPRDTDFAVIEIGMNHPGEISPLAKLARLDVAVVTIVAPAHLAAFENICGIAREKASILDGLRSGGTAILNTTGETAAVLLEKAAVVGARSIGFGPDPMNSAHLLEVRTHEDVTVVRATLKFNGTPPQEYLMRLQTPGAHFALNAVAALAATQALEADPTLAALAIGHWTPHEGRGTRETVHLDSTDDHLSFDLIDDAYNANPASVGAALDMLGVLTPVDGIGRVTRGRRIVVLGDMLELGPSEAERHVALAAHPAIEDIELVHCVGPLSRLLWDALPEHKRGIAADTAQDLAAQASKLVDAGDIVLVKGSLGIGLRVVVAAFRNLGQPAPETD